jgi:hypothetical protein
MRWTPLPVVLLVTACFDPESSDESGDDTGSSTSNGSGGSSTSSATTTPDDDGTATTSPGETTTSAGSSDDAADTTTAGPVAPTICDQEPTALAACATMADDMPIYGTLGCDATVEDFSVFYEDVYDVDLVAGQCLYARADNVDVAGGTMMPAADVALHVRSPSWAYAWQDDDLDCTDDAWTGGACPRALVTADVDGTYQVSVVQASGPGCTDGAPYTLFVAVDGVSLMPLVSLDDALTDCSP